MTQNRKTVTAAALSLISVMAAGPAGAAGDRMHWDRLPVTAFFEVFAYYCAPTQIVEAALPSDPKPAGAAADIHDGLFAAEYEGDCRAFYFGEIVQRINVPTERGQIVVYR